LHSPHILTETGLRMCLRRKAGKVTRSLLSSPFSPVRLAEELSRKMSI
jgi:hypothetical protein